MKTTAVTITNRNKVILRDSCVGFAFALLLTVLIHHIFGNPKVHPLSLMFWLAVSAGFLVVTCLTSMGFFHLMYKAIPEKSFIFDPFGNKSLEAFEKKTWVWNYKALTLDGKYKILSYAREPVWIKVDANLKLLEQGPQVRKFSCGLIIIRHEGVENALELRRLIKKSGINDNLKERATLKDYAEYLAYEFIEKKAPQLAALYNPRDHNQQDIYRSVLIEFIGEFCSGNSCLGVGCGSQFEFQTD